MTAIRSEACSSGPTSVSEKPCGIHIWFTTKSASNLVSGGTLPGALRHARLMPNRGIFSSSEMATMPGGGGCGGWLRRTGLCPDRPRPFRAEAERRPPHRPPRQKSALQAGALDDGAKCLPALGRSQDELFRPQGCQRDPRLAGPRVIAWQQDDQFLACDHDVFDSGPDTYRGCRRRRSLSPSGGPGEAGCLWRRCSRTRRGKQVVHHPIGSLFGVDDRRAHRISAGAPCFTLQSTQRTTS